MNIRFSPDVNELLNLAKEEALRLHASHISLTHIVLAMLKGHKGDIDDILANLKVDALELTARLDTIGKAEAHSDATLAGNVEREDVPMSRQAHRVMKLCVPIALMTGNQMVQVQHLLLSILKDEDSAATRVMQELGITFSRVATVTYPSMGMFASFEFHSSDDDPTDKDEEDEEDEESGNARSALELFSIDLTKMAAEGKLDPVVGRERETERVAQILARRKKNNPILLGEPGVGKTAIVEGLALRIATKKTAPCLWDHRVVSLDLGAVVAGTKYRGQFEERLRQVVKELKEDKNTIVFIDEIHTLIGAGSAPGTMDAANLLKPALSRGEIQCIGATTMGEYHKSIEKDGALERRFQRVTVEPTSATETLQILQQVKPCYEQHHNVTYTPEALEACVRLTERYVSDRNFPDKAIDAMDEAGASLHLIPSDEPLTVDEDVVARTVALITGVPLHQMEQQESERLRQMAATLKACVIGQNEAVDHIVSSIQRSRMGLKDPNRPIGSFLLVGPTGVGKTHLTKMLAREMFGSEDALIRLDMSEYQEKHTASRMIGAPPGYVGYDEGGQLTEQVKRKPYSIVLLDEIEKAHKDVFNLLLQIMDDGRLTDGNGQTVDFRNTIIIMTSNSGTRELADFGRGVGFGATGEPDKAKAHALVEKSLEKQFAPEFLNRLSRIIHFDQLSQDNILRIVDIELRPLTMRLAEMGHTLTVSPDAKTLLAHKGYDATRGARPLRRAIETLIEDPLCQLLLDGKQGAFSISTDESNTNLIIS